MLKGNFSDGLEVKHNRAAKPQEPPLPPSAKSPQTLLIPAEAALESRKLRFAASLMVLPGPASQKHPALILTARLPAGGSDALLESDGERPTLLMERKMKMAERRRIREAAIFISKNH